MIFLSSCEHDNVEHEHTFSDKWTYNETTHWHESTCGHDVRTSENNHIFNITIVNPTYTTKGYTRHTCSICGYYYDDNITNELTHNYSNEWSHNETQHYHQCIDAGFEELKSGEAAHTFIDEVVAPTYTTKGYTRHICSICGYYYDDTFVDELTHRRLSREE